MGEPFLENALIARLHDVKSRVIGVVMISNNNEKHQYDADDEFCLTQLLKPLSAVALTIEKHKAMERSLSSVESTNLKLSKSNEKNWLTTSTLKTSLKKVTQITSSLETKLWTVGESRVASYTCICIFTHSITYLPLDP